MGLKSARTTAMSGSCIAALFGSMAGVAFLKTTMLRPAVDPAQRPGNFKGMSLGQSLTFPLAARASNEHTYLSWPSCLALAAVAGAATHRLRRSRVQRRATEVVQEEDIEVPTKKMKRRNFKLYGNDKKPKVPMFLKDDDARKEFGVPDWLTVAAWETLEPHLQRRSPKYLKALHNEKGEIILDKTAQYPLRQGLDLLMDMFEKTGASADAAVMVNMYMNLDPKYPDQQLRTSIDLPHGTGSDLRVAVFCGAEDEEEVAALSPYAYGVKLEQDINAENLDFDVLLAKPSQMPKLAKLGRILGPARLMPSPKSGTVIQDYKAGIDEWKKGKLELRPDSYSHMRCVIGKVMMGRDKLHENLESLFQSMADKAPMGADRNAYYRGVSLRVGEIPAVKLDFEMFPKPPKRE